MKAKQLEHAMGFRNLEDGFTMSGRRVFTSEDVFGFTRLHNAVEKIKESAVRMSKSDVREEARLHHASDRIFDEVGPDIWLDEGDERRTMWHPRPNQGNESMPPNLHFNIPHEQDEYILRVLC